MSRTGTQSAIQRRYPPTRFPLEPPACVRISNANHKKQNRDTYKNQISHRSSSFHQGRLLFITSTPICKQYASPSRLIYLPANTLLINSLEIKSGRFFAFRNPCNPKISCNLQTLTNAEISDSITPAFPPQGCDIDVQNPGRFFQRWRRLEHAQNVLFFQCIE